MEYTTDKNLRIQNLSQCVRDVLLNKYSFSYASRIVVYSELFERVVESSRNKTLAMFDHYVRHGCTIDEKILFGTLCWAGYTLDFDCDFVFRLFAEAAQHGHSEAMYFLAQMYEVGDRSKDRLDRAFDLYTSAAKRTQERAQLSLGWCFHKGYLCDQDVNNAHVWYKRVLSQCKQGISLIKSVRDDSSVRSRLSLKLLEKAETFCGQMENFLQGFCNEFGVDVPENHAEALRLYALAAEAGNPAAQCALAHMYATGRGTPIDVEKSTFWLTRASKLGFPYAVYTLNPKLSDNRLQQEIFVDQILIEDDFKADKQPEPQPVSSVQQTTAQSVKAENAEKSQEEKKEEVQETVRIKYTASDVEVKRESDSKGSDAEQAAQREGKQEETHEKTVEKETSGKKPRSMQEELRMTAPKEAPKILPTQDFLGLLASARNGDPRDQFLVGRCYEDGLEVKRDNSKALEWLQKSADNNFAVANFYLGMKFFFGVGTTASPYSSFIYFAKAKAEGDPHAEYLLSLFYANGYGINKNTAKAEEFSAAANSILFDREFLFPAGVCNSSGIEQCVEELKAKAAEDDSSAQFVLFIMYAFGLFCESDTKDALSWLSRAADAGNVSAVYQLGYCYYNGWLVNKSIDMALRLIEKAAKIGHPEAMCDLGIFYLNGLGKLRFSYKNALIWFRNAASYGIARARFWIAMRYLRGDGVVENSRTAFKTFREGANMGDPLCLYWLGRCYYAGWGTIRDLDRAIEKYEAGVKLGEYNSIAELSKIYFDEDDEYFDEKRAIEILTDGAKGGNLDLQFNLASRYYEGRGLQKDLKMALYWFNKASESGSPHALGYVIAITLEGSGFEQHVAQLMPNLVSQMDVSWTFDDLHAKAKEEDALAQTLEGIFTYFQTKNAKAAYAQLEEAARNKSPEAQYLVAVMKKEGVGCPRDFDGALTTLEAMTEKKYRDLRRVIDNVYTNQNKEDEILESVKSSRLYMNVSDKLKAYNSLVNFIGNAQRDACCLVGLFYVTGYMIPRNMAKGLRYIVKACETTSLSIPFYMAGLMNKLGIGTQVDEEAAYSYYERAAKIELKDYAKKL